MWNYESKAQAEHLTKFRFTIFISMMAWAIAMGGCNPTITVPALPDWTATYLFMEGDPSDTELVLPSPSAQNTPSAIESGAPCFQARHIIEFKVHSPFEIRPNTKFDAMFSLKNTGSCAWTSDFLLVYASGNRMGAPDSQHFLSETVLPGSIVNISVSLLSPNISGDYHIGFKIRAPNGILFGDGGSLFPFTFGIEVRSGYESDDNLPIITKGGIRKYFPAGQVSHITAACPEGTVVTAGGFIVFNPRVGVFAQYMEKNGWTVSVNNPASQAEEVLVEVLCLNHTSAQASQHIRKFVVPERSTFSGSADCPAGSIVTGAGYYFNQDEELQIRQSVSNGNGWQLTVRNDNDADSTFYINVICLSGISAVSTAVVAYQDFQLFSYGVPGVNCPLGQATVGGGWDLLDDDGLALSGSYPCNDGWCLIVRNPTRSDQGLVRVQGVCLRLM
jgi:hypothetical protein